VVGIWSLSVSFPIAMGQGVIESVGEGVSMKRDLTMRLRRKNLKTNPPRSVHKLRHILYGFFSTLAFLMYRLLSPTPHVCLQPAMSLGPHWCSISERRSTPPTYPGTGSTPGSGGGLGCDRATKASHPCLMGAGHQGSAGTYRTKRVYHR
jgi:hypothetical protein